MLPESTRDVGIPINPVERVIGQDEAIEIAKIAAKQMRNLLLVGPPGIGKSMLAQAMAYMLPKPTQEIAVKDVLENPERPMVEIRNRSEVEESKNLLGKVVNPEDVPVFVAERLGFRCPRCNILSTPDLPVCSNCGADKYKPEATPFDDIFYGGRRLDDKIYAMRIKGKKEVRVLYERLGNEIIFYDEKSLIKKEENETPKKIIAPIGRNNFVQATGASETELLGDVRHDPYGGHPEVGEKAYKRVIPGAIHLAHEGVLFIDEISNLGKLQRHILTALQEKKFPIVGRNPTSSGAAIRVDEVPCDFILVGALNFEDIKFLLPPLRSRILGNGYEVLMNTVMEKNKENTKKIIQFIAQEIRKDGRIPHADKSAIKEIINEAERRAKKFDGKEGFTLRLRGLAGIIKLAGDLAISNEKKLINSDDVKLALKKAKTIEQQASKRYGSIWRTSISDYEAGHHQPADYTI